MKRLPILLIYTRLLLGILVIFLSVIKVHYYPIISIAILTIALLTDIFDGIIARKLNVSSEKLRRLDSTIDQIFFVAFVVATYIHSPSFFLTNWVKLAILFFTEILAYIICFIKFKKEIATHSIGAKIWTLFIFATLIQIILQEQDVTLFNYCFYIGVITRLEIIAIIFTLKTWANDVPTIYHAIQLRKGKIIKRYKMFNG